MTTIKTKTGGRHGGTNVPESWSGGTDAHGKMKALMADLGGTVLVFEPPPTAADKALGRSRPLAKAPSEKTLDELAQDMHTRPEP